MKQIVESLGWTGPKLINTKNGFRALRTAHPSPEFWGVWKTHKAELKALGVSARPLSSGNWEIFWWTDPETAEAAATPAPAPAEAAVDVPQVPRNIARKVENFIAPALDSSRVWSEEQNAIFEWFRSGSGSLVVRARAGTGKTTTIKAAFSQAPEQSMLYAVFNKKNQVEAVQAITDPRVDIKTLHAVGYSLIRAIWRNAKPDDEVEKDRARVACGKYAPDEALGAVLRLVGFSKNLFVNPSEADLVDLADERGIDCEGWEDDGWTVTRLAKCALKVLELSRERDPEGRISFNDMVWLPVAQKWLHPSYDLVCIDEAQDMNLPQLIIARGVCRPGGRICVVGDDRQAIYGFRGAASDGMDLIQRELNAQAFGLTITYRCPKAVVALAAQIVSDYRAAEAAPQGIVSEASETALFSQLKPGDAVLSRVNAPLMPLCLSLLRKGVPARIEGRDIGKQLAGIVKSLKAKSVPNFIEKIENWGKRQKARFANSKYAETKLALINDQVETLVAVAEGASSVGEIESRLLELFQDSDGNQKPSVVLSSVHKAKGLEWGKVALLSRTFKHASKDSGKEEANIYYVAVTRAKAELVLVRP